MSEFNIEDPEGCEKVDSFCVPKEFDGEGLLVVRMAGTNMEPLIRRDALVGIDLNRKKVISGEIYGLVLPYEGLVIRRVYLEPEEDRLVMSSENQSHADKHGPLQEYSSRIAGRVAWVMQDI
jgi:phage repressor protein C with HTH and peptisase S24 domain